ncbi:acyl transferase domain-containing protein [Nemania sp. NC0429]|nr:acyl transferase domain-containing protein [Nemania sp. NC0429]
MVRIDGKLLVGTFADREALNDVIVPAEFSQPLVTAIQLCHIAILESWGVTASSVVSHSSGEIAAAFAAGLLSRAGAIKAAFFRGRVAVNQPLQEDAGMVAVGLGSECITPFLQKYGTLAWIACFNSESRLAISVKNPTLRKLAADLQAELHFARLLQVDLPYHFQLMGSIGAEYESILIKNSEFHQRPTPDSSYASMFSR